MEMMVMVMMEECGDPTETCDVAVVVVGGATRDQVGERGRGDEKRVLARTELIGNGSAALAQNVQVAWTCSVLYVKFG